MKWTNQTVSFLGTGTYSDNTQGFRVQQSTGVLLVCDVFIYVGIHTQTEVGEDYVFKVFFSF